VYLGNHNNMDNGDGIGFQLGTEDCCFFLNSVEGERTGLDVLVDGEMRYQSYADRFLNVEDASIWVNRSGGASAHIFHSKFYRLSDDDSSSFFAGHCCAIPEFDEYYRATYVESFRPPPERVETSPGEFTGFGESVQEDIVPDNTEWATRIPRATPLGRITPTLYTLGTNLSVPDHSIHSSASPTTQFTASETFTLSDLFAPSNSSVASDGFGPSDVFLGPTLLVPSDFVNASRDLIPSAYFATNNYAASSDFVPSDIDRDSSRLAGSTPFTASQCVNASDDFLLSNVHHESFDVLLSNIPDESFDFSDSRRFASTRPFPASSRIATSRPHQSTLSFSRSASLPTQTQTAAATRTRTQTAATTRTQTAAATRTQTAAATPTPLPEDKTLTLVEVETVVESLTLSVSATEVTSLTFEESISYVIEVSVDENNMTYLISVETRILVVSVVRSAEYVPVHLPIFVTTLSRVIIPMDRYTTAGPSSLSNAAIIGIATGASLIAAVMGGVAVFITRRPKDEILTDSDIDLVDLNVEGAKTIRHGKKGILVRLKTAFSWSDDDESSESSSRPRGHWSDRELEELVISPEAFANNGPDDDEEEQMPGVEPLPRQATDANGPDRDIWA
jgi:hypothetical protein